MKITNEYLDISNEFININKKIFSSRLGNLIGINKWEKKGDTLLKMWKLVVDEPINPFYLERGEIAEKIVKQQFENLGIKHTYYGLSASGKKIFDLFETSNPVFGGVYDFVLTDNKVAVEVKSKNIKDFQTIQQKGADPTHLAEVELVSYLGSLEKFCIWYVFFTDEQEQKIKDGKFTDEDIKAFNFLQQSIRFSGKVNEQRIQSAMLKAYDYREQVLKDRKIPLSDISEKMLQKIMLKENDIFGRKEIK